MQHSAIFDWLLIFLIYDSPSLPLGEVIDMSIGGSGCVPLFTYIALLGSVCLSEINTPGCFHYTSNIWRCQCDTFHRILYIAYASDSKSTRLGCAVHTASFIFSSNLSIIGFVRKKSSIHNSDIVFFFLQTKLSKHFFVPNEVRNCVWSPHRKCHMSWLNICCIWLNQLLYPNQSKIFV